MNYHLEELPHQICLFWLQNLMYNYIHCNHVVSLLFSGQPTKKT